LPTQLQVNFLRLIRKQVGLGLWGSGAGAGKLYATA
jgi:hypothetical protein